MVLVLALVVAALLAFANGSNDVSKSVATLVGGGVTDYRRALRWGAFWTTVGALVGGALSSSLAERFARSLGSQASRNAAIPLAVAIASFAWVAFSSRTGLAVSTTHAVTGAVLGIGWAAEGLSPLVRSDLLKGFIVPLLASPVLALGLALLLGPPMARLAGWLEARCLCIVPVTQLAPAGLGASLVSSAVPPCGMVVDRSENCEGRSSAALSLSVDRLHWASSALVSLSRGMNDAPKIWGLVFPLLVLSRSSWNSSLWVSVLAVSLAMGLGSWVAGNRVTELLAERVTRMDHRDGFAANLVTALLVVGASRLGLPVSTTHVSSGAIVGVGLGQGRRGVDWGVLGRMAMAWVVTLPAAAVMAMVCYAALRVL